METWSRWLSHKQYNMYWVTRQDVAQETEKWAEWAVLASAADSAHSSVSCVTSSLVTQYVINVHVLIQISRKIRITNWAAEWAVSWI